ncbi:MAG: hypothetical protein IJX99_09550 [Clostridia bacterium]|nr:hypothetical protein [Clostridia bacterium]
MKKKSVWLVLAVVALVMVITLSACTKNKNGDGEQNNGEPSQVVIFEENANSFNLKAEVSQNEMIEKEIKILPSQSGTIKIKKTVSSGDLYVDVSPTGSFESLVSSNLNDEEVINIPEGAGTYQVRFNLNDFIGSCEFSWEVKDVYTEEDFVSAQGYEFSYIPEKFSYTNEDGIETFTLKSANQNAAELYFSVYKVDAAGKDAEKTRLKERATASSDCIFDEGALLGEYARFPQENGTEIMNFMFDLEDGSLLVIETLQFDEMAGNASANAYIKGLISSFSLDK